MGPRYRAPRNPTRSQTSSAKTVQTWHYILGKQLTALNHINALRARGSVYCSSRVRQAGAEWIVDGDPMEGALIAFAMKAGVDPEAAKRESPRLKEIPFDSRYRFMATLNPVGADRLINVKGAPERVLELCSQQRSASGDEKLDASAWRAAIDRLAARGQRVLAFASKPARGAEAI